MLCQDKPSHMEPQKSVGCKRHAHAEHQSKQDGLEDHGRFPEVEQVLGEILSKDQLHCA